MTFDALARAHSTQSFRPFAIRLADGRSILVPRPEFLAFNGTGRTAIVMDERDGFTAVDLSLMVSLGFEKE